MASIEDLRQALADRQRLPPEQARTMPSGFYTSEAFLDLEREQIFRKEWVCLGHVGEAGEPGSFFTTELVGEPLLVVHGRDGVIRVLSNVCRHRAHPVAKGSGKAKAFACPYHGWTYDTAGRLTDAWLMDSLPDFDKAQCPLPAFRTEIWQNFIFVNLSGDAEPLAPRLAPLLPSIEGYQHQDRRHVFAADDVWNTNWKCLTENFMEGYHLSITHRKTLHPITPTVLSEKVPGSVHFTAYRSPYSPETPERGPYHPKLDASLRRVSTLFCIFPSFVVSYASHFTLYMCLRPKSVSEVAIHWGVAGYVPSRDAPEVQAYVDLCNAFNAEDRQKLEALQTSMSTRHFQSGRLAPAPFEGTIWDFYLFMADRLVGPAPRSAKLPAAAE